MSKSNEYLEASLSVITNYIRGNINLEQATYSLTELGHSKKSTRKVLLETKRNNVLKLTPKKKEKKINNVNELVVSGFTELKGIRGSKDNFYIDMEIEDFIALYEKDDESYS